MNLGIFWWWGVFIVTIPVLFAAMYAPTLLIYLTAALLPWFILRRWRWGVAALVAIGSVALVALAGPLWLTAKADREAAAWTASDREARVPIFAGDTVALLESGGPYCSDACTVMLLDRGVAAVLLGTASATLPPDSAMQARMRLVMRGKAPCPAARWPAEGNGDPGRVEALDGRLAEVFGTDRCLIIDAAPLRDASLVFTDDWLEHDSGDDRWPQLVTNRWRSEALVRRGGGLVVQARRSRACVIRLKAPLALWPLAGADTSEPARWGAIASACPMVLRDTPALIDDASIVGPPQTS